jgi:hypothetical protein
MANFRTFVLATAAFSALAACGSNNSDTLIGMNLDENAAMMDANSAVDANLASNSATSANEAQASSASDAQSNHASDASTNAAAPKPAQSSHSTEVNAVRNAPASSPNLDDVDNQVTQPDVPNASSNDVD